MPTDIEYLQKPAGGRAAHSPVADLESTPLTTMGLSPIAELLQLLTHAASNGEEADIAAMLAGCEDRNRKRATAVDEAIQQEAPGDE